MVHETSCVLCQVVAGLRPVPGGVLTREGGFAVHAVADSTPVSGWVVLTSERHVRGWYDLEAAELRALAPLAAKVMSAQRRALGAEHVYAFSIGDMVPHFHLHLVPRYAGTPERLRGRRCFEGTAGDMLPDPEVARAATAVGRVLAP